MHIEGIVVPCAIIFLELYSPALISYWSKLKVGWEVVLGTWAEAGIVMVGRSPPKRVLAAMLGIAYAASLAIAPGFNSFDPFVPHHNFCEFLLQDDIESSDEPPSPHGCAVVFPLSPAVLCRVASSLPCAVLGAEFERLKPSARFLSLRL